MLEFEFFPLWLDGDLVPVRCEPVKDAVTLEDVSAAYLAKYGNEAETPEMVTSAVVATTLRLEPASI